MPRIEAAVKIYACLSRIESLKKDANKKLASMLLHPYPKVQVSPHSLVEYLLVTNAIIDSHHRRRLSICRNEACGASEGRLVNDAKAIAEGGRGSKKRSDCLGVHDFSLLITE